MYVLRNVSIRSAEPLKVWTTKSNNMSTPKILIKDLFRRLGTADAILLAVSKMARKLSFGKVILRRYYVFLQPIDQIVVLPARRGRSINVRLIAADDPIVQDFPRPPSEIEDRFRSGSECIVAESDGLISGFFWLHYDRYDDPEANVRFQLHPHTVTNWDFDLYVSPEHRGGWTFAKLWSMAGGLLKDRGIHSSVSIVWFENENSISSHRRLGAFPLFSAFHLKFGHTILHIAGISPRFCLIRPNGKRPTFHIDTTSPTRKNFSRFRDRG